MSTQPILLVIGIAIAVNLVIMGGLVVTLIVRRRGRYATPDGLIEPAPYRYAAMGTNPPTATSPISFMGDDAYDDEAEEYDGDSEDFDEDVSANEPADYRRFRPDMTDEGERAEATIESFLTGGSTNAVPPPTDEVEETERMSAAAVAPPPTTEPDDESIEPVVPSPRPIVRATPPPPQGAGFARDQAMPPVANDAVGRLEWEHRVREEESRLARYRRPVTVVLVELEGMERLLDRFGPDAAERIALPVGKTLARQARSSTRSPGSRRAGSHPAPGDRRGPGDQLRRAHPDRMRPLARGRRGIDAAGHRLGVAGAGRRPAHRDLDRRGAPERGSATDHPVEWDRRRAGGQVCEPPLLGQLRRFGRGNRRARRRQAGPTDLALLAPDQEQVRVPLRGLPIR